MGEKLQEQEAAFPGISEESIRREAEMLDSEGHGLLRRVKGTLGGAEALGAGLH